MTYPWSLILCLLFVYLLIVIYLFAGKRVSFLYDGKASTVALAIVLVFLLIFGLVRQDGRPDGLWGALGFTDMAGSPVFAAVLLCFAGMTLLRAIENIHHFSLRRFPMAFSHIALSVILLAGVFGKGDKQYLTATVQEGERVGIAADETGKQRPLPFQLGLKDFSMEEYSPRLMLANASTGDRISGYLTLTEGFSSGKLGDWEITVEEFLPMAGRLADSLDYQPMQHVGAEPAALVSAVHRTTGKRVKGWVGADSFLFGKAVLPLDGEQTLVMPRPMAKSYLSEVEVVLPNGKVRSADITVNHPLSVGSWKIYQSAYDMSKGRWSTVSILDCVRDPWYGVVQVGLWMLMLAALGMIMFAGGIKKKAE